MAPIIPVMPKSHQGGGPMPPMPNPMELMHGQLWSHDATKGGQQAKPTE